MLVATTYANDPRSRTPVPGTGAAFHGNERLLYGMILGVLTFWLFAQTTLNIGPDMGRTLGLDASMMNIAGALAAAAPLRRSACAALAHRSLRRGARVGQ